MWPVIEHIFEDNASALGFEGGRGYGSTITGLDFEEGALLELGIDNLEEFVVNWDGNKR